MPFFILIQITLIYKIEGKYKRIFLFPCRYVPVIIFVIMNFFREIGIICLFIAVIAISSCKKDHIITDSSAKIDFSTQAILFDTVFTTVGSSTRTFLVYNRNSQPIKISSIRLANGSVSNFRINVDGLKGVSFSDIEIKAKDSMFVFVEVTVNPNNSSSPLIIRDSVIFQTNGNIQNVHLEAWGQNAYFYTPNKKIIFSDGSGISYSVIKCIDWKNDKPHVIYGYAVVDSGCTLTILPGTKVYMHPNAVLWVYKDGTLNVGQGGDKSTPVIFQGDRLEPQYAEAAGQWKSIWLSPGSKNNVINWAIIKNGSIGIQADTMGASVNPTLTISNTIIRNMSVAALYAQGSYVYGWNCVFANCGQYVAALTLGGKYNFYHTTFANYWSGSNRQFPVLLLNNYYKDVNEHIQSRTLDSAYFYNCIVYGDVSSGDEIKLDKGGTGGFNYKFHNSVLKSTLTGVQFENVVTGDPYFYDTGNNDYRIKSPNSSAIGKGDDAFMNLFPYDLSGNPRLANPTVTPGAYEYVP